MMMLMIPRFWTFPPQRRPLAQLLLLSSKKQSLKPMGGQESRLNIGGLTYQSSQGCFDHFSLIHLGPINVAKAHKYSSALPS